MRAGPAFARAHGRRWVPSSQHSPSHRRRLRPRLGRRHIRQRRRHALAHRCQSLSLRSECCGWAIPWRQGGLRAAAMANFTRPPSSRCQRMVRQWRIQKLPIGKSGGSIWRWRTVSSSHLLCLLRTAQRPRGCCKCPRTDPACRARVVLVVPTRVRRNLDHIVWVQCEDPDCGKWRILPFSVRPSALPERFECHMCHWNEEGASCDTPEDTVESAHWLDPPNHIVVSPPSLPAGTPLCTEPIGAKNRFAQSTDQMLAQLEAKAQQMFLSLSLSLCLSVSVSLSLSLTLHTVGIHGSQVRQAQEPPAQYDMWY